MYIHIYIHIHTPVPPARVGNLLVQVASRVDLFHDQVQLALNPILLTRPFLLLTHPPHLLRTTCPHRVDLRIPLSSKRKLAAARPKFVHNSIAVDTIKERADF